MGTVKPRRVAQGDRACRTPRRMRLVATGATLPLIFGLGLPAVASAAPAGPVPAAPALSAPVLAADAVPGVEVTRVEWITDRRVALWIYSPSMDEEIQVQILVARDWHNNPGATFPEMLMLDGLRARDDASGWTIETDIERFFADKNVNVVLPIGGESSFYTDWNEPDNGKFYQWETFLAKELPPVLQNEWRTTDKRGITGLSMGGTAAVMLAERFPEQFVYVASYSGVLNTTSLGMPQAIQFAMLDAGGYDAAKMWGPPGSARWVEQDPMRHVDALRGKSIYISSGNGFAGPHDQLSGIPGISTNYAGMGLEILSRLTSQNFAGALSRAGIPATVVYRPSGTHSWPYWQFEMRQSWPQAAEALGVDVGEHECTVGGAIKPVADANPWLGACLTEEYEVGRGVGQDFIGGQAFWSPETGAHLTGGLIGGRYQTSGGPTGPLGFPITNEIATPSKHGAFNHFEHGSIYWSPATGAHTVTGAILDEWSALGRENGPLGFPVSEARRTGDDRGWYQDFQGGVVYALDGGKGAAVYGEILRAYSDSGGSRGPLGLPVRSEQDARALFGKFSAFENGNLYWSFASGAHPVLNGPIMDAWAAEDYEAGRYGFPTGAQREVDGRIEQDFQFGTIVVEADGRARSARAETEESDADTGDHGAGERGDGQDEVTGDEVDQTETTVESSVEVTDDESTVDEDDEDEPGDHQE